MIKSPPERAPAAENPTDELTRLRALTVAQARELSMMRWELSSLMKQAALAGRVNQLKHQTLRKFPGPVEKLARLKRKIVERFRPPVDIVAGGAAPVAVHYDRQTVLAMTPDEGALDWARAATKGDVVQLLPGAGYSRSLAVGQANEPPLRLPAQGSFCQWLVEDASRLGKVGTFVVESGDEVSLSLLKGRVLDGQTLVIVDRPDARSAMLGDLTLKDAGAGLSSCATFPAHWLDPLDSDLKPVRDIVARRDWPKISVVMVSYNQADYLEEGILSVLAQEYPSLEFILVDAMSNDGSLDIIEKYRSRIGTVIIEKDKGQSDGLNKGFARATGDILTWLNSDDIFEPGALFRVAQAFTSEPVDVVCGGCRQIGLDRSTILVNHHNRLAYGLASALPLGLILEMERFWLTGNFFFQPEVFFSRDIWNRAGGRLRTDLHYIMDYDLWVRLAAAGAQVIHIPEFLACSRTHDKQKTVSGMPFMPEVQRLLPEYGRRLCAPPLGT